MPIPKLLMYNDRTISLSDALLGTWWLPNYITVFSIPVLLCVVSYYDCVVL